MKKTAMTMAIVSSTVVCHAQSSDTLYGALDDGITYNNNPGGHYNFQASNGASAAPNGVF